MRQRFAAGDYLKRAEHGEIGCCLADERIPKSIDEPSGTRSLTISDVNEGGERIFMVHVYLRPDGSIGGSGLPDPKWLFEEGVIYIPLGFGTLLKCRPQADRKEPFKEATVRVPLLASALTRHRRASWFAVAMAIMLILAATATPTGGRLVPLLATPIGTEVIAPKVLTVTMFQIGDPLAGGSGEARIWVENDHLDQVVPIPGSYSPLYCDASYDHCLVITGVLASNAAATVMAVGLSDRVDLSRSYLMVAGIGGGPPAKITIGAAAWADWIVSGDLVTELDAREMPADWRFPKASLGCADQWCPNGFRTGTEVFQLDPTMTEWAFRLSRNVQLQDDPKARAYAQNYPEDVARGAPFVTRCAILGVNDFIHGTLMSEWSAWWVSQWTEGKSQYCMSADEEGGIFTALQRLAVAGRIDMRRVMVLRVATDIDRQYPGQTAGESLAASLDSTFGFAGLENVYRTGSPVVNEIVDHWERWQDGPPPLPS